MNIVNIDTNEMVDNLLWNSSIPISSDGTFSSTSNQDNDGAFNANINGVFYGTGHREVGGTFNRDGIIGAFGGTR